MLEQFADREKSNRAGRRGKKKIDWQEVERFAFEIGLTITDYYLLSAKQFSNYVEAYNRKVSKDFEHTRAICYYVAASNRDPKKSFPSIQKFWPLPTDGDTIRKLDSERAAKIRAMYEKAKELIHG